MSRRTSLFPNVSWRIVLDFFSRGTFFIINIFIARALGSSEFGKFGYAISLTQIFYIFTDLGIGVQLTKELGRERGRGDGYWLDFFELKIVLMLACSVIFGAFAMFFWHWEKPWILILMFLWMLSNSLLDFNQYVCNGLGRMDVAGYILLLHRLCVFVGVIVPVLFFRRLDGIVLGLSMGALLGAVVSNRYSHVALKTFFTWRGNIDQWWRILKSSIPVGIGGAFGSWYLRIGAVVLAWYWNSQSVGEYSAAFRIFEITYIVPAAVMSIALPHLSFASGQGREFFSKELKRVTSLMGIAGLSWSAFLYLGSRQLVYFLFGIRYQDAIPVLRVFAAAGGMVFLTYFVTSLMVVVNLQKRHALNEILTFVVCCLLSALLIPTRGSLGAAYALFGTECFLFLVTVLALYAHRHEMIPKGRFDTIPINEPS